jgi:hypothetical protein
VNVELRGTIRTSLATSTVEVPVPAAGLALSELLNLIVAAHPRAARYLQGETGAAALRVVHNGTAVRIGEDPLIRPEDSLLLIHAISGGSS